MISPDDQALVDRDAAIPGLALLLDTHRLTKRLRTVESLEAISDVRVDYLRYKPGQNCVVRIKMRLGDQTLTGYAKAHREGSEIKLDKSAERTEYHRGAMPGRVRWRDAVTEFNLFPNDNGLDSIGKITDTDQRGRLLNRIFKERQDWRDSGFEILNYKPERRLVICAKHPDGRRVVIKFMQPKAFEQSKPFHKNLRAIQDVRLQTLVGRSKTHHALAFDWIPGDGLDSLLRQGKSSSARLAGTALAVFHASRQNKLRVIKRSRNGPGVSNLAADLASVAPGLSVSAMAIARRLEAWRSELPPEKVPVHGDFNAEQVIISDQQPALIDFDRAYRGHAADDLGSFIARLELDRLEGIIASETAAEATAEFLNSYGAAFGRDTCSALATHAAFALARLMHQPFRHRIPNWLNTTEQLLERCKQWLEVPGTVT